MSSPPTTPMSQASTKFGLDSSIYLDDNKGFRRRAIERGKEVPVSQDIFLFLLAFRILNALSIKTFFQPDEFFQSLEPAWEIAFGANSGAWITWEWRNRLRSAIHPAIFAAVYMLSSGLSWVLHLSPTYRADLLVAAPKVTQAIFAAVGDYYTWKLGERVYGSGSNEAWATLALTVCKTTLTVVALNLWPWHWSTDAEEDDEIDKDGLRTNEEQRDVDEVANLRRCLLLAALACILRPTNILIWACFATFALLRITTHGKMLSLPWEGMQIWVHISCLSFLPATKQERKVLVTQGCLCGSLILMLSTLIDRLYYEQWTFPPFRFLYFNIAQSLAVFYGRNDWHYYLSQGYPLLLTTFLPFGLIGIWQSLFPLEHPPQYLNDSISTKTIKYQLATTAVLVPCVLSFISHKEVRFVYPLLPLLHTLAAVPFTTFFLPGVSLAIPHSSQFTAKRLLLAFLLIVNISIAIVTTTLHQTAPFAVMTYLRNQHTKHYLSQPPSEFLAPAPSTMTVGFLMPCHSTPWRSHLVHSSTKAWALTCEPPVNMNASARASYVDEADRFYADPKGFLATTLGTPPTLQKPQASWFSWFGTRKRLKNGFGREEMIEANAWDGREGLKRWPEYVVFFEQMEQTMKEVLVGSGYRECWRGWNSWGHDDWRRRGDMLVWCLRKQGNKEKRKGLLW
ncbi:MAG: glycosylphosphatidylinositol anchor biosynthesis [Alectoria sarmentosa]|nr:MAG: glycosylphosphatidylinositol anchor biosynthesis [Alectoria sarmentosa]